MEGGSRFGSGVLIGILSTAVVVLAVVAIVLLVGGDDDPQNDVTDAELQECPIFETAAGSAATDVRTTVDCSTAESVASEVLGSDDCVEETAAGVNECVVQGFTCETRIEDSQGGPAFAVTCSSGEERIEFKSIAGG